MILQKRHAMPSSSMFVDWLRSPAKAWLHRWASPLPALEADNDSRPAVDEAVALDIDLALMESLASLRKRAETPGWTTVTDAPPRRDFADGWRTRPNVRFVDSGVDVAALVRSLGDDQHN